MQKVTQAHCRDSSYSAAASALGYLYQCRLALVHALEKLARGDSFELSVETLDDVVFEDTGAPIELLQAKHHLTSAASLTDASTDLWSTLRVWLDALKAGRLPAEYDLLMLTTSIAPEGSAASFLGYTSRDTRKAAKILKATATASKNQSNSKAYKLYLALPQADQIAMLDRVRIFPSTDNIDNLLSRISSLVYYATENANIPSYIERLEGWWMCRVIGHLQNTDGNTISSDELESKQIELREQFSREQLPIDEDIMSHDLDFSSYDSAVFVRQMRMIGINQQRIRFGIQDFYRASVHRSRWMREKLLYVTELERYDRSLHDAWARKFEQMRDSLGDEATETEELTAGKAIYAWLENHPHRPLRRDLTETAIARGSYQLLADNQKVGWHIAFVDQLLAESPSSEANA